MLIKRTSVLTGKVHEMEIPVTEVQLARWKAGELIQDVMPNITADQREFIISGITPEEWDEQFKDEAEDDMG